MMMGLPLIVGWMMHFMIGIIFAFAYSILFIKILAKVNNVMLKGAIFGFIVFIFAQISMAGMGAMMGGMPPMEGSMMLIMIGSIMGHIIYGIVVAMMVKQQD